MAIMLRELEVPTRLVNGFRTGEYNRFGDDWTVRQYDAHSWVEAYFAPYGWYEFDPTPPDPQRSRPAFRRLVANLVDAVDLWWWEEVVNYDFWKQYQLVGSLLAGIGEYQHNLRDFLAEAWERSRSGVERIRISHWLPARGPMLFGSLALSIFVLWLIWHQRTMLGRKLHRAWRRLTAPDHGPEIITSFYAEALDLMKRRGFRRAAGQTPLEFVHSLGDHAAAGPLKALTHLYNRARFSAAGVENAVPQAERLLSTLRQSLK
jgi:hypothetical protein